MDLPRDRRDRRRWRLLAAAALVVLLVGVGGARLLHARALEAALLRTDDSRLAARPDLLAFAAARAQGAYRANCARCHGGDRRGDPQTGAPNLMDGAWIYGARSPTQIERTIAYGIRSGHPKAHNLADMPAFGRPVAGARYQVQPLSPQDVDDLVAYLFHIEGRAAPDTAAVARGQTLFAGRGQCFDCHAADAEGDDFIGAPNLRDTVWNYGDGSAATIRRSILHGRAGVCPAWDKVLPPATVRALAVDLFQRSHPPAAATAPGAAPHA
jgi:cytochrome c oxidase cbb3-type subunit 3